jgi:hypothetical protein
MARVITARPKKPAAATQLKAKFTYYVGRADGKTDIVQADNCHCTKETGILVFRRDRDTEALVAAYASGQWVRVGLYPPPPPVQEPTE